MTTKIALYVVGLVILIAGLAYAASLAGVPQRWIIAGSIIVAGIGLVSAAADIRHHSD